MDGLGGARKLRRDTRLGEVVVGRCLADGIVVIWSGVANVNVFHKCALQVVIVIFEINGNPWILSCVYASMDYRERRLLW